MLLAFFLYVMESSCYLILPNHSDSNIEHYLVKLILINTKSTCILFKNTIQVPKEMIFHPVNIT